MRSLFSRRMAFVLAPLIGAFAIVVAAERDPLAAEVARREGSRALAAHDFDAAVAAFERALSFDAENTDLMIQLGMSLARRGDADEAIGVYRRALEIDPAHARALNNLANVFYRRNDFEQAAEYYRAALESDPDYLLALLHFGKTQHQLNRTEEAEEVFLHCTSLPVEDNRDRMMQLDCRYYLGTLRFRAGDYESAAAMMGQVVKDQPGHSEARYFLGMAFMRLGRTEEGRRQLEIHRDILRARRDGDPIEKKQDP